MRRRANDGSAGVPAGDLAEVMSAMRAGWRSSEEQLRATAVKRMATARWHQEQADALRKTAEGFPDEPVVLRRRYLEAALRHEVLGASRRGAVTRSLRQVALRLVPAWTGTCEQLLAVAQAVADPPGTRPGTPSDGVAEAADPAAVSAATPDRGRS